MVSPTPSPSASVWTPEPRRSLGIVAAIAFVVRIAVALGAGNRFPPAHDGVRYFALAARLAEGQGYTWVWPNGSVTPVAHYPIGYPALLASTFHVLGATPRSASLLNAALGTAVTACVFVAVAAVASHRAARIAGLGVALHPGLVVFTPCIMSEGAFTAALSVAAVAAIRAACRRDGRLPWIARGLAGLALGGAILVRPQAVLFVPVFAWIAASGVTSRARRLVVIAVVSVLAIGVCVPWTVRNGRVLGRYALVSMNGGWNLLIGAQPGATGGWQAVRVPPSCEGVFGEAETDRCFGVEATRFIVRAPLRWILLARRKLAITFDCGAIGGYYLFLSNRALFPWSAVLAAAGLETLVERAALFACLVGEGRRPGAQKRLRTVAGFGGAAFLLTPAAWISVVALAGMLVVNLSVTASDRQMPLRAAVATILWTTIATHAVFFGEPRFAFVTYPWVIALAAVHIASTQWRHRLPALLCLQPFPARQ
jgi:4-amino-4-deoxy-L-arabinose transferase-like glycosyltransferase